MTSPASDAAYACTACDTVYRVPPLKCECGCREFMEVTVKPEPSMGGFAVAVEAKAWRAKQ